MPASMRGLFFEALITSAWVKLSLKFFPFKQVMAWLGNAQTETPITPNPASQHLRAQVKNALILCNRYALWPTECYTLALTGKLLLKRRHIASTLYIGFSKTAQSQYKGHAWLRANDTYICGWAEAANFTTHSCFS